MTEKGQYRGGQNTDANAGDECRVMTFAPSSPRTVGGEPESDTHECSDHKQAIDGDPPSRHRHQLHLPSSLRDDSLPSAARRTHLPEPRGWVYAAKGQRPGMRMPREYRRVTSGLPCIECPHRGPSCP